MLFNSWLFVAFAIVVIPLYYALPFRPQNFFLLVASYVFYGAWDWRFLGLILASTIIDYFVGIWLHETEDERRRKMLVSISVCANLGILGFFKYFDFFVRSAEAALQGLGFDAELLRLHIVLPVGISFYTFQTMSYTIDIYRRQGEPTRNFLDFAVFVAYFPQLVAGPIERATHLLPQISKPRTITHQYIVEGCWLILWGFFKKLVIADNMASVVFDVFNLGGTPSGFVCLLGVYAFAYQIYCDFSGYSDIARGLARLMGIDIMVNFRMPYISRNPQEFWTRWHISLSTWLRDYLYIPLGGNRHGLRKTYRNLFLTMLLGGLWHGAAWTFVLWGVFHGVLLAAHRYWLSGRKKEHTWWSSVLCRIGFFHLTCLGWLLFRALSVGQVGEFLTAIFTDFYIDPLGADIAFHLLFFVGLLWILESYLKNTDDPRVRPGWNRGMGPLVIGVIIWCLVFLAAPAGEAFLYFQF